LGFANGHLFLSSATKICPNFSNQTTTFLEKKTDLSVPSKAFSYHEEVEEVFLEEGGRIRTI
jgi:hypothetical protein